MLDDATSDRDLRVPPGNHLERLRGILARLYSIRVSDP
jgi:toxin HigB-1